MHAKGELANQVADTFHAIEGAKPLSLDNIPDVTVTNAHETALVHDDTLLTALDETLLLRISLPLV